MKGETKRPKRTPKIVRGDKNRQRACRARWEVASKILSSAIISGKATTGEDLLGLMAEEPYLDAMNVPQKGAVVSVGASTSPEEKAGARLARAVTATGYAKDLMQCREAAATGVRAAIEGLTKIVGTYNEDLDAGIRPKDRRITEQTFLKAANAIMGFYKSTTPKVNTSTVQTGTGVGSLTDDELMRIATGGRVSDALLVSQDQDQPQGGGPGRPRSKY